MKTQLFIILLVLVSGRINAQDEVNIINEVLLKEAVVSSSKNGIDSFERAAPAVKLDDLLQSVQGINLISRSSSGNEISLQGVSSERLDITISGIRIAEACTDKMDPINSNISSFITKSLDVSATSTGPSSGNTGTVNIGLITPHTRIPYVRTKFSQGFQSTSLARSTNLSFEKGNGKQAVLVAAGLNKAENYRMGNGQRLDFSQTNSAYFYLAAVKKLKSQGYLESKFLFNKGWDMGFPALPMDVSSAGLAMLSVDYSKKHLSDHWLKTELKFYTSIVNHVMDDTKRPNVIMHMDMPGRSNSIGLLWENKFKLLGKSWKSWFSTNRIFQYADMTMYGSEGDEMFMLTWPGVENFGSSAELEVTTMLNPKYCSKVKGGVAYNLIRPTDELGRQQWSVFTEPYALNRQSYRPQLQWEFKYFKNSDWTFKSELGFSYRNPSSSELFGFYLFNRNDGFDYLGNPTLKNEGRQYLQLSAQKGRGVLRTNSTLFVNHYSNFIQARQIEDYSAMTPGAFGVRQYENMDFAVITGIETKVKWLSSYGLKLEQDLKFIKGMALSINEHLAQIAPFSSKSAVFYKKNNSQISLSYEYTAQQALVSKSLNEDQTPSFHLIHMAYIWNKQLSNNREISIDLRCNNLFDRFYHNHLSWNNIPSSGRNIIASIRVTL